MKQYLLLSVFASAFNLRASFLQTSDQYIVEEYKTVTDPSGNGQMTDYKKSTLVADKPIKIPGVKVVETDEKHKTTVVEKDIVDQISESLYEDSEGASYALEETHEEDTYTEEEYEEDDVLTELVYSDEDIIEEAYTEETYTEETHTEESFTEESYSEETFTEETTEIISEPVSLGNSIELETDEPTQIIQDNSSKNVYIYEDSSDCRDCEPEEIPGLIPVVVSGNYEKNSPKILIEDDLYNLNQMNGDSRFIDGFISEMDVFNNNGYIEEEELLNSTPMWGFVDVNEMIDYELENNTTMRGDEITEDDLIDGVISGTVIRPIEIDGSIVQAPTYVAYKPPKQYIVYTP